MKILLVSCTLPPEGSATAALISNLCEHFTKMGHSVDGITQKKSIYDERKTPLFGGTVYHANYVHSYSTRRKKTKDLLYSIYKRIHRKFFSENRILYTEMRVHALYKEMMRVNADRYDVIMAVCAQYDSLEAVLRFVKKTNYHGKIALYQVDPLSDNEVYESDGKEFLLSYELEAVRKLDYIFTTPLIYREKKHIWNHSNVLPLEFPALLPRAIQAPNRKDGSDEIKCVFAGYLHRTLRNPQYTLDLFASIKDPRIHLYIVGAGYEEMLRKYAEGSLAGRLHLLGQMSIDECDAFLEDADVLVNIGNSVANMTPSKIFNYIGYGKPILNIVRVEGCPTLHYMEQYPLAYNVAESESVLDYTTEEVKKWLLQVCGQYIENEIVLDTYKECTPFYVARQMITMLQKNK